MDIMGKRMSILEHLGEQADLGHFFSYFKVVLLLVETLLAKLTDDKLIKHFLDFPEIYTLSIAL